MEASSPINNTTQHAVDLLDMASNSTEVTLLLSSTDGQNQGDAGGHNSDELLIGVCVSLAALVTLLAAVLLCVCWRKRRNAKQQAYKIQEQDVSRDNSVLETNGAVADHRESNADLRTSGTETQVTIEPRAEIQTRRRSSASAQPSSLAYGTLDRSPVLDLNMDIPHKTSQTAPAIDYENMGQAYVNHNFQTSKSNAPPPKRLPKTVTIQEAGANDHYEDMLLPPRLPHSNEKEVRMEQAAKLFRKNSKAYHLYINAVEDYETSRKDLQLKDKLGRGHFGQVFSAIVPKLPNIERHDVTVAVKTMKRSASDKDKQEFLYELEIMKLVNTLKHPNIIKLLGCVTLSQPYIIILELMANGCLQKFLRDTMSNDVYYNLHGNSALLTDRHLLKMAQDIAQGMEGVASLQFLHRDLAARNILVDRNLTCKIADFGFAKDVLNKPEYKSKSVFQRPRPTRWLAPESLLQFKHSIQSDVWSYGIVLWEIVTLGNLPYPGLEATEVTTALAKGYRMSCPRHCSRELYKVMEWCWAEQPAHRPTFEQLVCVMAELVDKAGGVIDMERIENTDYIEVLPPREQELLLVYAEEETLE